MSDDEFDADRSDPLDRETLRAASSEYKVRGKDAIAGGAGVVGYNTAASGNSYGVEAVADSPDRLAAGLLARAPNGGKGVYASADSGAAVYGTSTNEEGGRFTTETGSTALFAKNRTDNTPNNHGIQGQTTSAGIFSAGVSGLARSGSGETYGVSGRTLSGTSDAAGVHGEGRDKSARNYGVLGTTRSSTTDAAGVRGAATAGSGTVHGVYGTTSSSEGYGVYADSGAKVSGDLEVTGTRSVGAIGVDAARKNDQSVPGSLTRETVVFDTAYTNDGSGYDTSTGVFTAPYPGAYQIDTQVVWETNDLSSGDRLYLEISGESQIYGGPGSAETSENFEGFESADITLGVSRTFFGLQSGDTLEVVAQTDSSGGATINGVPARSFLTIAHLG